jgi:hypothetical protein
MDTTNTLNHELTSGASIIDIDDMGYEMSSKSMTVDENINDSVRSSTTLTVIKIRVCTIAASLI